MTCEQAQQRLPRAADGSADDAELWHHIEACRICGSILEEHATVSYLVGRFAVVEVPPDFARRVRARIGDRATLFEWTGWKPWTLRLAPLAAGLLVCATVGIHRTPPLRLEMLMEHWMSVRDQVPATGLFWHDAPDHVLLEAVLDGHPDAAMRLYYPKGAHEE